VGGTLEREMNANGDSERVSLSCFAFLFYVHKNKYNIITFIITHTAASVTSTIAHPHESHIRHTARSEWQNINFIFFASKKLAQHHRRRYMLYVLALLARSVGNCHL